MNAVRSLRARTDRGVALLLVVVATGLLSTIGLGLVLIGETESTTVWNARGAEETRHAADAMAAYVVGQISGLPSWTPVLGGSHASGFAGSLTPTTEYGESLDLVGLTSRVQSEMPSLPSWAADVPVWHLFAHGPQSALAGVASARTWSFVAAWVADDGAERDGDPRRDTNGVVSVLAQARGVGGAARSVHVVLSRVCPGESQTAVTPGREGNPPSCSGGLSPVVRVLSWREL